MSEITESKVREEYSRPPILILYAVPDILSDFFYLFSLYYFGCMVSDDSLIAFL